MNETLNIITRRLEKPTLISEDDIKIETPMSANKSKSTLISCICVSQDLYIKKILTPSLYDLLMAEWIAVNKVVTDLSDGQGGGQPPQVSGDTTNYRELYECVYKPLVWWSYTASLSTTAIQVGEAGLLLRSTDNAESGGVDALKKLVAENEAIARAYTKILIDYIETTFSEDCESEGEKIGAPSIGVFVARKRWHKNNNSNY